MKIGASAALAAAMLALVVLPAAAQSSGAPGMLRDFSNARPENKSGNGSVFATTTGAQTSGRCVQIDANGNHIAAPEPCRSLVLPTSCTGLPNGAIYNNGGIPAICGAGSSLAINGGGCLAINGGGCLGIN